MKSADTRRGESLYQCAIVPAPPIAVNVSKNPQPVSCATRFCMATIRGIVGIVSMFPATRDPRSIGLITRIELSGTAARIRRIASRSSFSYWLSTNAAEILPRWFRN